jgi:ribosomal protein S12 methylthiotransferase
MNETMTLHLVSLGCAKNLVDSEIMLGRLRESGWDITDEPVQAQVIIINTCSFIESAVNEAIDTILELAKFKEAGNCRSLIVTGCLPQRFREGIVPELPEADMFLGTGAFDSIAEVLESLKSENRKSDCLLPDPNLSKSETGNWAFRLKHSELRPPHSAFIKISEGCSRHCTYCIIPKLRGKQRSRPPEDIVSEASALINSGVKELVLVAQDTTNYGADLLPRADLADLVRRISDLSPDIWVRILYGHPESITESLIKTVADRPNICDYFDIPVQHASDRILRRMGRNHSADDLYRIFETIRSVSPQASLRTGVIVGFPGETDTDFEAILKFAEKIRFDHLGAFMYSDFDDLASHRLPDHIPKKTAKQRYERLMSRQSDISLENNQKYIGKTLKVLAEEKEEDKLFAGRAWFQAPEVDGVIYIHSPKLEIGTFANVKITDALEYDLIGETV